MLRSKISRTLLFLTVWILLVGCSSNVNIMSPDSSQAPSDNTNLNTPGIAVEEVSSDGTPISGEGVIGLYQVTIDSTSLSAEISNMRSGALDDVLEIVDITNFLALSPCTDCAKIESIELDSENHIVLKIGIKHPFPAGDESKPITARNRGDLHVFNIEGTVIFDDSSDSTLFPGIGRTIGPLYLVNADGYSAYLDDPLDDIFPTTADVHPYILHFDDYTAGNFNPASATGFENISTPGPSGNLVMKMGSDYDVQDYVFDIPDSESVSFVYAIGCTYAIPALGKINRFKPEYQVPQHNKKAASEVWVEVVTNNLETGNTSSTADLMINVLDINHGVSVGDGLDQMKADSSVSSISLELPGIISGVLPVLSTPTGGSGRDPLNPLTFPTTITNDLGATEGSYWGIVKVNDSYNIGLNVTLPGDAMSRVEPGENPSLGIYQLTEFATYQIFKVDVTGGTANTPPVAMLDADPAGRCTNEIVTFDASLSYDAQDDTAVLLFEFDFDYDGTFVSDTVQSNDPTAVCSTYLQGASYVAAVRVFDTGGLPDIATVDIGPSPSPSIWTADITDGTSIQNVVFHHSSRVMQQQYMNRMYAAEGMAYGDGWTYLTFYTTDGDVYFTRSNSLGETWESPTKVATGLVNIVGSSIDAVGSEVFIVYAEESESTITLLKNTNAGSGTWESYLVADYPPLELIACPGVSVDPSNTDYVYVLCYHDVLVEGAEFYGYNLITNTTGGSGAWNETYFPYWVTHNGRQTEMKVASDGTVYVTYLQNTYITVFRSDDHGATFNTFTYPGNSAWTRYWAAEMDMCVDPNDPDVVYVIWGTQGTDPSIGMLTKILLMKSTDRGNNFTVVQENLCPVYQENARKPAVMVDKSGRVYISFTMRITDNDYDIFVRSSCDGGLTFSDSIQFNTVGDDGIDSDPEIAFDESGGAVIAWTEDAYTDSLGSTPPYNPSAKIVARHID